MDFSIEEKKYCCNFNGLQYTNIAHSEIVALLGETEALHVVLTTLHSELKEVAWTELSKYDWMYVREYRMANTETPMPVPEHIATHYEAVRQWVDQQELLLASMTIEQLEAHEFIVPTL